MSSNYPGEQKVSGDVLKEMADAWTRQMWLADLWQFNTWLGFPILQWPTDLIVLQDIIVEQRPRVIIETGSFKGGSAVFFASMLKLTGGGGRVISVDWPGVPEAVLERVKNHEMGSVIDFITGDSTAPTTIQQLKEMVGDEKNVFVVLDSDHSYLHVKRELEIYRQFIPLGGYLVAGDTICAELAKLEGYSQWRDDNPLRAVHEFLLENDSFVSDADREKFMVTFFPEGYLKRVN